MPEPGDAAVDERRIVMAVDSCCVVPVREPGDFVPELRLKTGVATKRHDLYVLRSQFLAPGTFVVDAANGHWNLGREPPDDVHHKALGAARMQTEDHLQDTWVAALARRHTSSI